MDDPDYFPDGLGPTDDAAYRDYAVFGGASGGARIDGRPHVAEQVGSVWQQLAEGPWSPVSALVTDQVYAPRGQQSWDPGGGWPNLPPGSRPWPPARETWNEPARDLPADYPQEAYRPGYGAAPTHRPRDNRPCDRPREDSLRDSGPRRRLAPDDVRRSTTGTSLLAGYAPGTGPIRRVPGADDPTEPQRGPSSPRSYGKSLPYWLPFGSRLVLLPKEAADDGDATREHRDVNGGWLRPAVFGAMDGLVTNASLIAGIGGGGGGHGAIVLTGIAGLIAGAFSMATGEYISVKSQNELTEAEVDLERRQHALDRAGKLSRLTQLFMDKGVSPNLAEAVARQISADPERAIETHVREELGIDPDDLPSPRTAAVASFLSFTVGALIPLSPFLAGIPSLPAALVVSGLFAFTGGAAVARLTGRSAGLGGLRQFVAAFLATGMAFFIGHLVGGHIG